VSVPVDPRTLELQALRRRVAEEWLAGSFKELVLRVLDDMVLEADEEQRSCERIAEALVRWSRAA
jgi:hypothetical protein